MELFQSRGLKGEPVGGVVTSFVVIVQLLSCVRLFCDAMDCSTPGSSVYGISQQEYCSGLPFPSPGDLSDPGIEPGSPALVTESPGKPR